MCNLGLVSPQHGLCSCVLPTQAGLEVWGILLKNRYSRARPARQVMLYQDIVWGVMTCYLSCLASDESFHGGGTLVRHSGARASVGEKKVTIIPSSRVGLSCGAGERSLLCYRLRDSAAVRSAR